MRVTDSSCEFVDDPVEEARRKRAETFSAFLHDEVMGAGALLVAAIVALVLANSPIGLRFEHFWELEAGFFAGQFHVSQSLLHWIDDALMALFFFVVGLEIKREVLVGELSARRKAALPILAAVGGMIAPALIYVAMNAGGATARGWGIPMATDIAFVIGVMALLGDRVPSGLKVFLVALAIADDIGAILVIAIFYTAHVSFGWLGVAAVVLVGLIALNRAHVDSPVPYAALGIMLWFAVLLSGVHATIAGVLVAFTIPAAARIDPLAFTRSARSQLQAIEAADVPGLHVLVNDEQQRCAYAIRAEARHTAAPLQRLEFALHPWTTFLVLPLFALANAGVRVIGVSPLEIFRQPVALGVILGLLLGKPLGITIMSWIAVRLRLADLPEGVGWAHIGGAGILGGIGFTMSIFVTGLAFRSSEFAMEAKAAVLGASLLAGILGYLVLAAIPKRA